MNKLQNYELTILVGIDEQRISICEDVLMDAEPIFQKMDHDMSRGWQLGRQFVPSPNKLQRCQIAADRLLTALHTENSASMNLMAGFILSRLPGVASVNINDEGETNETMFYNTDNALIS
ncbi:MAG: hypothetical protein GKR95_17570 [Gammaproteobacteria bacterium]|nr:hypothetical protein [Gammaproteobacteria bacterium]